MSAPTRFTDEQSRAIERRHGNLLLDAAAGSGKTSVLVERFVRAVLGDGVGVREILAITFTEKAAAELRDRIRSRFVELGEPARARETEGAAISTIHGFCARLLRGHALAAGLDPGFEVLDRARTVPLQDAAFDAAAAALAAEDSRLVDLVAAYTVPTLRSAVLSLHDALRSAGSDTPRLPPLTVPGPEESVAVDRALRAGGAALAAELSAIDEPGVTVQTALRRLEALAGLGAPETTWPPELWRIALPRTGTAALATDAAVAYREAVDAYRRLAAVHAAIPVHALLDGLLRRFAAGYRSAKAEVSGIDFEDLELLARDLLAADVGLRERTAGRYASIMVDEFQDTNRVQLTLIRSIARDNLFTVGDAQQSIYGFRHADVELFRERARELQARGERETLRTNFRTRPEIIDVLNPAFADPGALGEDFTPLRAGREPSNATEACVELLVVDKGADWELEGMAAPWRLAEARGLAERIGEWVAAGTAPGEIVVLMRATTDMRAYERALEQRGLPTYVIGGRGYWAHPQVVDMLGYLRALANPREEEALLGVLVSPLVGLSLDGLVIVAAAARGRRLDPWGLIRDRDGWPEDLAPADAAALERFAAWYPDERRRAARTGVEGLLEAALTITGYDTEMLALPGGRRRLANVRKLMRLGREHAARHGPDLRRFLDDLDALRAGGEGAREGEAPVEGEGLDAVRLMTIHRAKGLEFPAVCVADLGRTPRPPSTIARLGGDGRLGLRLARAGAGGRESALDYVELGRELQAADQAEERRLFYVAMTRARERLLLTGAAKLDAWREGNPRAGGGPICWIAPAFVPELAAVVSRGGGEVVRDAGRLTVRLLAPPADAEPVPAAQSSAPAPSAGGELHDRPGSIADDLDATPATLTTPPVATLSYSALAAHRRCGYRFYAERVLGLPATDDTGLGEEDDGRWDPGDAAGDGPDADGRSPDGPQAGRRRGILAHALLQRLDHRRPVAPGPEVARAAAIRAGLQPAPGPEELDRLAALVRRFADSELCARLGRAREVRREQRFAFPLSAGSHPDSSAVLVVGALDVVAREPGPTPAAGPGRGRLLIVDYKTDRLDGTSPSQRVRRGYGDQQLVYALAGLHAGAAEVEVVHVFLEAPEDPVSHTIAAPDLPTLAARLAERAAPILARRFPVAADPRRSLCAGCPAEGGLCSWPLEQTRRESADTLF